MSTLERKKKKLGPQARGSFRIVRRLVGELLPFATDVDQAASRLATCLRRARREIRDAKEEQ